MRLSKKLDCFVISDNVKNDRAEKDSAIYLWRQSHNKTISKSISKVSFVLFVLLYGYRNYHSPISSRKHR